jgi:DNA-directed RNA polymerase subunit K/omega
MPKFPEDERVTMEGDLEEDDVKKGGASDEEDDESVNESVNSEYDAADGDEYDTDDDVDEDDDDDDIEKELKEDLEKKKENQIQFELQEDETDDDDNEDDEDDEDDNTYYQRFHENMKKDIVEDFHPEMKYHNYDEIEALTAIIRDSNGRIIDPNHQTLPFLTKYEKTRILGERAKQINSGAQPLVDVDDDIIDGYLIALKEFEQKKIPFIIKRPIAGNRIEYWKLSDLEIIS